MLLRQLLPVFVFLVSPSLLRADFASTLADLWAEFGSKPTATQDVFAVGEGDALRGTVKLSKSEFVLTTQIGKQTAKPKLKVDDIIAVENRPAGGGRTLLRVYLWNGEILSGSPENVAVTFQHADGLESETRLDRVRFVGFRFDAERAAKKQKTLVSRLLQLPGGQRLALAEKQTARFDFLTVVGKYSIDFDEVTLLTSMRAPQPLYRAQLKDGSKLTSMLPSEPLILKTVRFGELKLFPWQLGQMFDPRGAGVIEKVADIKNPGGKTSVVWTGVDPLPKGSKGGTSVIKLKGKPLLKSIRIDLASKTVPSWNEIDAVGLKDSSGKIHWAVSARASTRYSTGSSYDPSQMTGPPNAPIGTDSGSAWASATADGRDEWIELDYAKAVRTVEVHIVENYSPGAVVKISRAGGGGTRRVKVADLPDKPVTGSYCDLAGGLRLVGTPTIETIHVLTETGRTKVPAKNIARIDLEDAGEKSRTFTIALTSGKSITGALVEKDLPFVFRKKTLQIPLRKLVAVHWKR